MMGAASIPGCECWQRATSGKFDPVGAHLADGHYSRRTPGSPQFMPPGETIVLIAPAHDAVWGWWRPHPNNPFGGTRARNGLDGWTCSIFRRLETAPLASELVLDAERALCALARDCGPDGMLTYVWGAKIRSSNPGWCNQLAGWRKVGWSADRRKRLLGKPFDLAGIQISRWP